jgi:predicted dehydrogenase
MRVGIIGCGAVARYCHVPALKRIKDVTLAAVADPDEASRSRLAQMSGAAAHASAAALLAQNDIDAVVIAAPSHIHASIAIEAAKSGKAFYLEKPVATAMRDAHYVCWAAASAGVAAAVGFNRRAHPLYVRARELVRSGAIGEVRAVQSVFSEPTPKDGIPEWKRARATGGGVLLDLASHHVDLVRWLTNTEVVSVSALATSSESDDDSATLTMTLTNEATAQCFFSLRHAYADHLELFGEKATLRVDRHKRSLSMMAPRRFGYGARERVLRDRSTEVGSRIRRLVKPGEDPSYHGALMAFVSQVRGEREALASLDDGRESLAIVLAAEESVRSGSPVKPATIA